MPIFFIKFIIWIVRLLFSFSCYLTEIYFQSYLKIFRHCCSYIDFLLKISDLFMSLWKFQKLDHSKYRECYILFEPELCVDSDFPGFKSFMITPKKYKLPKHSSWLRKFYIRKSTWGCGIAVITTAKIHLTKPKLIFIQVQPLILACERLVMVRISDNGAGWK